MKKKNILTYFLYFNGAFQSPSLNNGTLEGSNIEGIIGSKLPHQGVNEHLHSSLFLFSSYDNHFFLFGLQDLLPMVHG